MCVKKVKYLLSLVFSRERDHILFRSDRWWFEAPFFRVGSLIMCTSFFHKIRVQYFSRSESAIINKPGFHRTTVFSDPYRSQWCPPSPYPRLMPGACLAPSPSPIFHNSSVWAIFISFVKGQSLTWNQSVVPLRAQYPISNLPEPYVWTSPQHKNNMCREEKWKRQMQCWLKAILQASHVKKYDMVRSTGQNCLDFKTVPRVLNMPPVRNSPKIATVHGKAWFAGLCGCCFFFVGLSSLVPLIFF